MKETILEREVKENMGLVRSCANKFLNREMEYDDIFQAGCLGLIKAIKGYDKSRGFAFSTYAVPVIIGEIKGLFRNGTNIKAPRDMLSLAQRVLRESENFEKLYARAPCVSELAEKLQTSEEKVCEAIALKKPFLPEEYVNSRAGAYEESCEKRVTDKLALIEICKKLSKDEKELLRLRFILNKSQSETAAVFGVSQMQISRRERKILLYLRGAFCD